MFSGDLYDIRSLSFDLLLACVSMLFRLALFMVCFSFCLNSGFFIFIIVSCCRLYLVSSFFSFGGSMVFLGWLPCLLLAYVDVVDSVVVH